MRSIASGIVGVSEVRRVERGARCRASEKQVRPGAFAATQPFEMPLEQGHERAAAQTFQIRQPRRIVYLALRRRGGAACRRRGGVASGGHASSRANSRRWRKLRFDEMFVGVRLNEVPDAIDRQGAVSTSSRART